MTSDDREIFSRSVERFASRELEPRLDDIEHGEGLPRSVIEGLGALGLLGLDPADGGLEHLSTALDLLSRTTAAPAALLLAHAVARQLLLDSTASNGASEIKSRALADGALLGYPLYAEPGLSGATDGVWELCVGAPVADFLVLPATEREIIVVERDAPGVEVGPQLLTLGMRGCPIADVRVPPAEREHRLPVAVPSTVRRFRGPAVAIAAGIVERSLHTTTDYALSRYQAGSSIIRHQQVRAMLAGMVGDATASHDAALRLSQGLLAEHAAMALFIETKERAARATIDGVQLLGGYGYMEDYGQERCMRDARQAQCLFGRTDVQRQELVTDWLERRAAT